jgi:hypothetical protein
MFQKTFYAVQHATVGGKKGAGNLGSANVKGNCGHNESIYQLHFHGRR